MLTLTRTFAFSSAHRLDSPHLDEDAKKMPTAHVEIFMGIIIIWKSLLVAKWMKLLAFSAM